MGFARGRGLNLLPIDYGPHSDARDDPAPPPVESIWIEPEYPDTAIADGVAGPQARYEQRESTTAWSRRRSRCVARHRCGRLQRRGHRPRGR
jgi:hypothetical protein